MRKLLLVLVAGGLLAACTRTATVQIRNPAQAGVIDPNRVVISYPRIEQNRGLPRGSLNEEASLVSYEPQGACFQVALNNLEQDGQLSDVRGYEIRLVADDDVLPPPTVTPEGMTAQTHSGLVPERRQTGETTQCVRRHHETQACEQWDTRPTYATVMVPGPVTVVSGAGTVCFPNNGALTPGTQEVALEFRSPGGMSSHRFTFEWQFIQVAPPPGQQAPAQQPQQPGTQPQGQMTARR